MDIWTLLNIEVDILADDYYHKKKHNEHPNIPMKHEMLSIWIDDNKLSQFNKQELYNMVCGRDAQNDA